MVDGYRILYERIQRIADLKNVGIILAITFVIAALTRRAESTLDTLDKKINYSSDLAYKVLGDTVEQATQWTYIKYYCLDCLFAVSLAVTQILIIVYLLKMLSLNNMWGILFVLPLIRGICDIFENNSILFMLLKYPQRYEALLKTTNVVTQIKWISMKAAMFTTLAGVVLAVSFKVKSHVFR